MSAALVPVKGLADGKSRLLPEIGAEARRALCLAMLGDLIEALQLARRVERVAVVTPDREVERAARRQGAEVIPYGRPGLNRSIDYAARALRLAEGEPLLVVLGDLAGAVPADIDALFDELDRLGGRGAVLAPASDGGSAALLRAPHEILPAHFGANSASAHREHAERRGIPWRERPLPSLALDLDDARDVERFLAGSTQGRGAGHASHQRERAGRRTRTLLQSIARPSTKQAATGDERS